MFTEISEIFKKKIGVIIHWILYLYIYIYLYIYLYSLTLIKEKSKLENNHCSVWGKRIKVKLKLNKYLVKNKFW